MFFGWGDIYLRVRHNWRLVVAIIIPLLLIPIATISYETPGNDIPELLKGDPGKKFRCLYVIILMAIFWLFEVLPLAITSLLPLVLFPLLRIQQACLVSKNYMKESNMIFLGSIIIALAIEFCGLHKRAALQVISIFGVRPPRIMMGTMIFTAALSMFITDTSTTTMILPILSAVTTAMFQEEQADTIATLEEGEEEGGEDHYLKRRTGTRRLSNVFANSAMENYGRYRMSYKRASIDSAESRRDNPSIGKSMPGSLSHNIEGIVTDEEKKPPNVIPKVEKNTTNQHDKEKDNLPTVVPKGEKTTNNLHDKEKDNLSAEVSSDHLKVIPEEDAGEPGKDENEEKRDSAAENGGETAEDIEIKEELARINIRKMLLFAVAYAANIGGTGSLIGTGPIKVFKELNKNLLNHTIHDVEVSFTSWMAFGVPTLLVNLLVVWIFLTVRYYGFRKICKRNTNYERENAKLQEYLKTEHERLGNQGKITGHEIGVLCVFILAVILWLTRDPQLFEGWDALISPERSTTGDSTPAMLAAVLLFIIPKKWKFLKFKKPYAVKEGYKYEALLDWKFVSTNAPWGYVILIGSGYAIADASDHSGLSRYIGYQFEKVDDVLNDRVVLLIVIIITTAMTEVVSNTACATLLLPTLFSFSCHRNVSLHPTYLTMAASISASYAFMLPISSPPNAIIFATGDISIKEMILNGFVLNVICIVVLYCSYITYGEYIFHFSKYNHKYNCGHINLC